MLCQLLDFTVSIQQRMEKEKCNLLSNIYNPLFCSTFKPYLNVLSSE